jgi:hypothetical protein
VRTSFCTQRSRTCKRPGVVLSIDSSAPATVRGTLRRASLRGKARYQAFGSVDFGQVAAGPRQLRFTRTKKLSQNLRRLRGAWRGRGCRSRSSW